MRALTASAAAVGVLGSGLFSRHPDVSGEVRECLDECIREARRIVRNKRKEEQIFHILSLRLTPFSPFLSPVMISSRFLISPVSPGRPPAVMLEPSSRLISNLTKGGGQIDKSLINNLKRLLICYRCP